ncbi:hypothetical protein ES705_42060 [subsurface metagenome]
MSVIPLKVPSFSFVTRTHHPKPFSLLFSSDSLTDFGGLIEGVQAVSPKGTSLSSSVISTA